MKPRNVDINLHCYVQTSNPFTKHTLKHVRIYMYIDTMLYQLSGEIFRFIKSLVSNIFRSFKKKAFL